MATTNHKIETSTETQVNGPALQTDLLKPDPDDLLVRESDQLRAELEIERDARLRLAAEYQNYRRRTEQEKAQASDKGKSELLTELLSITDDLDRALDRSHESPETVVQGLQMIHRRFLDLLASYGVTNFASEGERFDPERHEAFDVVPAGMSEPGTVNKEMRRGFFFKDRLLRPALVVVNQ